VSSIGYYWASSPLLAMALDDDWPPMEQIPLSVFGGHAIHALNGLAKQFQTDEEVRKQFVERCMSELGNQAEDGSLQNNGQGNSTVFLYYSRIEHSVQE
jgi:hypothetical protein